MTTPLELVLPSNPDAFPFALWIGSDGEWELVPHDDPVVRAIVRLARDPSPLGRYSRARSRRAQEGRS